MLKRLLHLIPAVSIAVILLNACSGDDGPSGPVPVIESFSPEKGLIETTVTLTGTNFSDKTSGNEVSFNGTPATVLSATPIQIVTKVPVGATTGKITVKVNGVAGVSKKDFSIVSNPWARKNDFMGGVRTNAIGFAIGTKGYIGLGSGENGLHSDLWSYTPETDTWTKVADFPGGPRSYAISFVIGTKAYVGLGKDPYNVFNDLWEYNAATNTWTKKADLPAAGRKGAISFVIGSKAYVGTGEGSSAQAYSDFWEYDATANTWQKKADFAGGNRSGAIGFALGEKGYLCTGINELDRKKDLWEYSPATNSWTRKSDFPGLVRYEGVAFVINGDAYVGTGIYYTGLQRDFYKYDADTDTWNKEIDLTGSPDLAEGIRGSAVAFAINNKGYVGPGFEFGIAYKTSEVWEFTVK